MAAFRVVPDITQNTKTIVVVRHVAYSSDYQGEWWSTSLPPGNYTIEEYKKLKGKW